MHVISTGVTVQPIGLADARDIIALNFFKSPIYGKPINYGFCCIKEESAPGKGHGRFMMRADRQICMNSSGVGETAYGVNIQ